jgi:hypothetical protein
MVKIEISDILNDPILNIVCCEESDEKCFDEVKEELEVLWKEIVEADDSELAPDAIRLKQHLLSLKR